MDTNQRNSAHVACDFPAGRPVRARLVPPAGYVAWTKAAKAASKRARGMVLFAR